MSPATRSECEQNHENGQRGCGSHCLVPHFAVRGRILRPNRLMPTEKRRRAYQPHAQFDCVKLTFHAWFADPGFNWEHDRAQLAQVLDLFAEDSWRNVYAGRLEVRPPAAPTTQPDSEHQGGTQLLAIMSGAVTRRGGLRPAAFALRRLSPLLHRIPMGRRRVPQRAGTSRSRYWAADK
jgi:hypothetical protein